MKGKTICPSCNHTFIVTVPEDSETHNVVCPQCKKNFSIRCNDKDKECGWEEYGEPRKTVLSSLKKKTNKPNIASFLLLTTGILGVFTAVIYGSKDQPILAELQFFTDLLSQTFEPAIFSVILIIFSLCAFIGSLTSYNRRYYIISLICAVLGTFSIGFFIGTILSIIAFILLVFSKVEFENGSKIRIF